MPQGISIILHVEEHYDKSRPELNGG